MDLTRRIMNEQKRVDKRIGFFQSGEPTRKVIPNKVDWPEDEPFEPEAVTLDEAREAVKLMGDGHE